MAVELEGQVGASATALASGTKTRLRLGAGGDVLTSELHGRYYQLVKQGNVYTAQTAVSGVAPGTSIGTTGAFTLYNPDESGKDLEVLLAWMGYISGTLGAGTVFYTKNSAAAVPTGTAIVPVNALLGSADAAVATALTTSTIASPTSFRTFCSLTALLAGTAVAPWQIIDDVGGGIVIKPDAELSLEGVAVGGSTPLVVFGMMWREVPTG